MADWNEGAILEQDMVPGKRYLVKIDDCCVEGHFTATYVGRGEPEYEGDTDPPYLFDNGFVLIRGGWIYEENARNSHV